MPSTKPKPYNLGRWTEARFTSFVKSALRRAQWPPKFECIKRAYVRDGINPATGRRVKWHECAGCKELFMQKDVRADHIDPVVDPVKGFIDWNTFIQRLFCPVEGLQALCKQCHDDKSNQERIVRKENRGNG